MENAPYTTVVQRTRLPPVCNTISVSVSAGMCVKPVPLIRFCLNGAFTYATTKCNEHNIAQSEISGSLSLSACYSLFGLGDACMSVELFKKGRKTNGI